MSKALASSQVLGDIYNAEGRTIAVEGAFHDMVFTITEENEICFNLLDVNGDIKILRVEEAIEC